MNDNSPLTGTTPLTPGANRVWEIEKKRKADDRRRRNRKRHQKDKDEEKSAQPLRKGSTKSGSPNDEDEDQSTYGAPKTKKRGARKIDLTI